MRATERNETLRSAGSREENSQAGAHWNRKELLERLEGNRGFFCELLRIFLQDSQANLQKAKAALWEQDLQGVMRAAHTLKGMLRNLSMNRAAEIAFALETASLEEKRERVEPLLAELEEAVAELFQEVEAQLAEVKA